PLTRMRNHIEDLQSRSSDPAYESLLDEADHLLNTFTALLRITRIETEQQRTHFDQISLDQIMSDVISFYAPLAEEKQISLTSSLIESDIKGDKDLIFQAFANILDNAIKFTPENGTITVKMDMNGPKQIRIIIEDSGHGIKKEDLEKVFDRFYRADMSRNKAGVGLGLSLVRAVISLHKGDITLENSGNGLRIITNL
ncbi:MAG: HAMP domain-containing sensor histidine kinase, partial [Pseudomonadota bacterium]|nr:HAMP domain-containing sensor histidine kinase [Pseudomonadota bacterium]